MIRSVVLECLFVLAVLPLAGCGSKARVEAEADPSKKIVVAQVESPTLAPAVEKKTRPGKAGKTGRTPDGPDPDLMDMEQRYKILVNRIRPGMTKDQVEVTLGTPDETDEKDLGDFNPQKAGEMQEIWTWRDIEDEKKFIMLSFVNGKLQDGGTPGYDIRKGFKSKLPDNMDSKERKKLKDAAKRIGIDTDDE